jgi:hypothetical protein
VSVKRFDIGELREPQKMANGWLKVDAHLTRTGVFTYRNPDGTERRELRLPEEVFHADSLKSFGLVPLTNGHPPEGLLTSENTARYQVGTIGEGISRDGELVRASIVVTDAATIKEMENGKRTLSCGYVCDLEEKPGVTAAGERFDAIQRSIRGNHVALESHPRAGQVARVRMDTADAAMVGSDSDSESVSKPLENRPVKIRIDSVEVEVSDTAAQLIEKSQAAQAAQAAALKTATDAAQAQTARADALDADLKKAKAELAETPAKVRAQIEARVSLETKAREILGDVKLDGKSDREVKLEVLASLDTEFKADGKSDAYVDAAFDYQSAKFESPAAEVARVEARTDSAGSTTDPIAAAQAKFEAAAKSKLKTK